MIENIPNRQKTILKKMMIDKQYYNKTIRIDNELYEYFCEMFTNHPGYSVRMMVSKFQLSDKSISKYKKLYIYDKKTRNGTINII